LLARHWLTAKPAKVQFLQFGDHPIDPAEMRLDLHHLIPQKRLARQHESPNRPRQNPQSWFLLRVSGST